ncbi:hypothetical protein FQA39_LY11086 [Lamprigera yunnana]|nr:hypothetical protein FQA39_LY11086 [Lamprigera yunnana]
MDISTGNVQKTRENPFLETTTPKESKNNDAKNAKYYFAQYCGSTSIHGIQYLGERGRYLIERLVWVLNMIIVTTLCSILIAKMYNKWKTSPVLVSFATTESSIDTIPFPSITICPQLKSNPEIYNFTNVFLKKIHEKNLTKEEDLFDDIVTLACGNSEMSGFRKESQFIEEIELFGLALVTPPIELLNLSTISWMGQEKTPQNYLNLVYTKEGLCFNFNMLNVEDILRFPEEEALNRSSNIERIKGWSLDTGYPTAMPIKGTYPRRTHMTGIDGGFLFNGMYVNKTQLDFLCGESLQGFKVVLHHPADWPNLDKHFRVSLDTAVYGSIRPRLTTISDSVKHYDPEDRKCFLMYEKRLQYFKSYTQYNCMVECEANYTLKHCSCVGFYMPKRNHTPLCGPGSLECMKDSTSKATISSEEALNRSSNIERIKGWSLDTGYPTAMPIKGTYPRRTHMTGIDGGFLFNGMYVNKTQLDFLCGESLQGFKVVLHHPADWPNLDKHFRVSLDTAVYGSIRPRLTTISDSVKHYDPEDRKCFLMYEKRLQYFKSYTQYNCMVECEANYTLKHCSCVGFYMPKRNHTPLCGPGSLECMKDSTLLYLQSDKTICNCLPSCTSLEYDLELTETQWDWKETYKILKRIGYLSNSTSFENAHLSRLGIFFKELQFLSIERNELYGVTDFLSNIGGLLGLFMGFSVTSIIEILYFCTLRLWCNYKKFGRRYWSEKKYDICNHEKDRNKIKIKHGRNCKYYFAQFCQLTSIHGLKYLSEGNRYLFEKVWWFMVVLLATVGSCSLIYQSYVKWNTAPIVVTLAMTETPIWKIPFPAVTICPELKTDPKTFNYSNVYLKYIRKQELTDTEYKNLQLFSLICESQVDINGTDFFTKSEIRDLLRMLTHSKTDCCKWLGKEINCSSALNSILTLEGKCQTFNMLDPTETLRLNRKNMFNQSLDRFKAQRWSFEKGYEIRATNDSYPRRTTLSGINSGFQIDLYVNDDDLDYICGEIQGFKVSIHHPGEIPDLVNYFRVPLDQVVVAAVKPNMITTSEKLINYDPKIRQCYLPGEVRLNGFKMYTQRNCLLECLSEYIDEKCGCTLLNMPYRNDTKYCGPGKMKCVEYYQAHFMDYGTTSNSESMVFQCGCLPLCTSLSFDAETSQTDWNWRKTYSLNKKYSQLRNFNFRTGHYSRLIVFYKELQFLASERHEVYGFVEFCSNCGGLLGLFLGFSFTSSMEIVYFLSLRLFWELESGTKLITTGSPTARLRHKIETGKQQPTTGIIERTIGKEKRNSEEQHESEIREQEGAANENGLPTPSKTKDPDPSCTDDQDYPETKD